MGPDNDLWHAKSGDEICKELQCGSRGLTQSEALERLSRYGPNRMKPPRKKSWIERFLSQFHNVLIYVLLAAAAVTAMLEHWIDAGVILGVVVVNAVIGVVQEGKAEKALDAIRKMLSSQAMARRDGTFVQIPAEELVPGDIVTLQSGDKVPADLRLIAVKELQVDEAVLTGESLPVAKRSGRMRSSPNALRSPTRARSLPTGPRRGLSSRPARRRRSGASA